MINSTRKIIIFITSAIMILFLAECNNPTDKNQVKDPKKLKEDLIHANKAVVETESQQIDDFIERHHWPMKETSTGLRYFIYRKGNGPMPKEGSLVAVYYTISLLTGDTVYTSDQDGPLRFVVGKAQVISGLEEGILLLRQGDRAKFIIPSHLAYGLIGDQKKIKEKASLVYDIDVLQVKN